MTVFRASSPMRQLPSARLPVAQPARAGRGTTERTGISAITHSDLSMLMGGPREQGKNHRQAILALGRRRALTLSGHSSATARIHSTGTGDPRRSLNQAARRRRNPIRASRPTLPAEIN
ncbi:hypothetical protein [Micromonospora chalcea]|uniref:hypothetical protein n=1 Tax=Micromonospora chalcea TaxID=1874 RepID=UPI00382722D0